jgi:hypothetical protein
MGVSLDVSLDVFCGLSFGLAFGRNTCSTGYTAPVVVVVVGARHARIEGFGAIPLGGGVALRSSPRSMPRSM